MGTLNPKFYFTSDKKILINLDDISFISVVPTNSVFDSYMQIYMKGNNNGIKVKYADGLQIINILAVRDDCKIYWDQVLDDPNPNNDKNKYFVIPTEQSDAYILNIKSIKDGNKHDRPSIDDIHNSKADYKDVCYVPTTKPSDSTTKSPSVAL